VSPRARLGLLWIVGGLVIGCAGPAKRAGDAESKQPGGGDTADSPPMVPAADTLPTDPASERPAGEVVQAEARSPARFRDPGGALPRGRPALRPPLRLALVVVREGQVQHRPERLLRLERLLANLEDVRAVVGLGPVLTEEVGLADLALLADEAHVDLLLVEVQAGRDREGFLVHAPSGDLLARYRVPPAEEASMASAQEPPDLLARLEQAFTRLE
jgi:hypothetical protein